MKTSTSGRALITQREGCRLVAYRDSKGIPTIGVGHVDMTPPVTKMGMTITAAQADAYLEDDLGKVEAVINSAVKVPISQNEFDALASLGFNIGAAGLKGSTVIKKLNVGDIAGAAQAFLNWAKPVVLISRRRAEMAQFLKPDAAVAADRAQALATKAEATKAQAKSTSAGAVALAIGGAGAAATSGISHSHHWGLILAAGGLLILAAGIAALVAAARHATAQTLAANAAGPTDFTESLKQ